MNITLADLYSQFSKALSVGDALQNILFYGFITFLIFINISLINRKNASRGDQVAKDSGELDVVVPNPVSQSDHATIIEENIILKHEVISLKAELLAIGEELELSYTKSDRLYDQLSDIIDCLELTVAYDDHLWNWSIDFKSDEITFSEYGMEVWGIPKGRKLTWIEALALIDDQHRKAIETALQVSMKTGADFSMKYKIVPANGSVGRWIKSFGRVVYSDDSTPLMLTGKFSFTYAETISEGNEGC